MSLYKDKSNDYYRHVRVDILNALPNQRFDKVLELGAGGCDTLAFMKEKKLANEVTAVELFDLPGTNQQNSIIDKLIIGDIASLDSFNLPEKTYNLIICGDVLEHTYAPWDIVLIAKKLLANDGLLICSVPNFRFYGNMRKIFLKGDFGYTKEGILDKTHIRFFCKKNLLELFKNAGYTIVSLAPDFKYNDIGKIRRLLNIVFGGAFEEFFAFQYIIKVTPF